MTMYSPAQDIAEYLCSSAGGSHGAIASSVFAFHQPDSPDDCITVLDGPGQSPDLHGYFRPGVQILIRATPGGWREAYERAKSVVDDLHATQGMVLNNSRYVGIWLLGEILSLGPDEKNRPQYSINFTVHRTAT